MFITDEEKMYDFTRIDKDEFLFTYSYLTEKEYDDTALVFSALKGAKEFLALNAERDELNEASDWDGAFEVECDQRDIGGNLACFIIEHFGMGV